MVFLPEWMNPPAEAIVKLLASPFRRHDVVVKANAVRARSCAAAGRTA